VPSNEPVREYESRNTGAATDESVVDPSPTLSATNAAFEEVAPKGGLKEDDGVREFVVDDVDVIVGVVVCDGV
jgi:hypothetical protein